MERKLLLITNRKSVIPFQNPGLYLACYATWRRKRHFVTSGLPQNRQKITNNSETVRNGTKVLLITDRISVFPFQNPGLYLTCDATWRRKQHFVTSGLPQNRQKSLITQKRYEMERKLLLINNSKSMFAFQNLPS